MFILEQTLLPCVASLTEVALLHTAFVSSEHRSCFYLFIVSMLLSKGVFLGGVYVELPTNPFSTAVSLWRQTTRNETSLSQKRDWSIKIIKRGAPETMCSSSCTPILALQGQYFLYYCGVSTPPSISSSAPPLCPPPAQAPLQHTVVLAPRPPKLKAWNKAVRKHSRYDRRSPPSPSTRRNFSWAPF